jgi:hypothetical protein
LNQRSIVRGRLFSQSPTGAAAVFSVRQATMQRDAAARDKT